MVTIKLSIVDEFVLDSHHMGFNINLTEAFPSWFLLSSIKRGWDVKENTI